MRSARYARPSPPRVAVSSTSMKNRSHSIVAQMLIIALSQKSAQNHAVCISQAALTQWRNICRTDAELTQSGYEPYGAYWTYTHTSMHRSMHLQAQIRPATADIPSRSTSSCLAPMRHRLQQAGSNNFAHTSTHVDISHKSANSFNSEQLTTRWCSESIANHGMTSSRHHLCCAMLCNARHQTTTNQLYWYNAQLRVQNAQFGYRTDIGYSPLAQHSYYTPCPPICPALGDISPMDEPRHQTTTNQLYWYNAQLRVQNAQFGYRTDIGYCPIVQHPFYIPCPPIYSALALPCIPDHASLDLTTHMSPACMYTSMPKHQMHARGTHR